MARRRLLGGELPMISQLAVCYRYRKAAKRKDADALNALGGIHEAGTWPGLPQSYEKAGEHYQRAADKGHLDAQTNLGYLYEKGLGIPQDLKAAAYWYRKAAEKGFAKAQNNLGSLYYTGNGVPLDNYAAVEWYRAASRQGNASAMNNLGICYEDGLGVDRQIEEAMRLYKEAAENGNLHAHNNLGYIHLQRRQYTEAMKLFELAAQQGSEDGMYNLAGLLERGYGAVQNKQRALELYAKAAQRGHQRAHAAHERLLPEMSQSGAGRGEPSGTEPTTSSQDVGRSGAGQREPSKAEPSANPDTAEHQKVLAWMEGTRAADPSPSSSAPVERSATEMPVDSERVPVMGREPAASKQQVVEQTGTAAAATSAEHPRKPAAAETCTAAAAAGSQAKAGTDSQGGATDSQPEWERRQNLLDMRLKKMEEVTAAQVAAAQAKQNLAEAQLEELKRAREENAMQSRTLTVCPSTDGALTELAFAVVNKDVPTFTEAPDSPDSTRGLHAPVHKPDRARSMWKKGKAPPKLNLDNLKMERLNLNNIKTPPKLTDELDKVKQKELVDTLGKVVKDLWTRVLSLEQQLIQNGLTPCIPPSVGISSIFGIPVEHLSTFETATQSSHGVFKPLGPSRPFPAAAPSEQDAVPARDAAGAQAPSAGCPTDDQAAPVVQPEEACVPSQGEDQKHSQKVGKSHEQKEKKKRSKERKEKSSSSTSNQKKVVESSEIQPAEESDVVENRRRRPRH
ncbi:hypothetical protein CYMTET_49950 [Cymbomonas tetramitiformis]|uniref:Uncharacterized protein n=1 Tax=Cymbomonas tetramitiformis TaxID=36881 RepID=A0AAE0BPA1_9CHLO|nr:hypothetical protein CYMTET_49950 [Cymbomonas tetramitiformis]